MVAVPIYMQIEDRAREIVFMLMQRPITEEIVMKIGDMDGFKKLEIVDGNWTGLEQGEYMGGERHGWIESLIISMLTVWAVQNKAGRIYSGDTDFVLEGQPKNIILDRKPDIAFVRSDKVTPSSGFNYLVPDLAVEITSPSDRPGKIQEKITEYLKYGVQQVWQVYPETQQIIVYLPDGTSKTYGIDDTIPGGDLLPSFELEIKSVFEN